MYHSMYICIQDIWLIYLIVAPGMGVCCLREKTEAGVQYGTVAPRSGPLRGSPPGERITVPAREAEG